MCGFHLKHLKSKDGLFGGKIPEPEICSLLLGDPAVWARLTPEKAKAGSMVRAQGTVLGLPSSPRLCQEKNIEVSSL